MAKSMPMGQKDINAQIIQHKSNRWRQNLGAQRQRLSSRTISQYTKGVIMVKFGKGCQGCLLVPKGEVELVDDHPMHQRGHHGWVLMSRSPSYSPSLPFMIYYFPPYRLALCSQCKWTTLRRWVCPRWMPAVRITLLDCNRDIICWSLTPHAPTKPRFKLPPPHIHMPLWHQHPLPVMQKRETICLLEEEKDG